MNPEHIARLITEDPDQVLSESLFHLTTKDRVEGIKKSGLRWDVSRRYQDAGSGIYLFAELDNWVQIAEYLGDIDPKDIAIIQVAVDMDDPAMLMDEDSMSYIGERDVTWSFRGSDPELAEELEALLAKTPKEDLERVKQKFIEDHGLKPTYTDIFRHQILTGRYAKRIHPSQIENIYHPVHSEFEEWEELEPEQIAQKITSDPI
jgi:hypothetical protein